MLDGRSIFLSYAGRTVKTPFAGGSVAELQTCFKSHFPHSEPTFVFYMSDPVRSAATTPARSQFSNMALRRRPVSSMRSVTSLKSWRVPRLTSDCGMRVVVRAPMPRLAVLVPLD